MEEEESVEPQQGEGSTWKSPSFILLAIYSSFYVFFFFKTKKSIHFPLFYLVFLNLQNRLKFQTIGIKRINFLVYFSYSYSRSSSAETLRLY